jgi:predicted nicotinamide N-methyase
MLTLKTYCLRPAVLGAATPSAAGAVCSGRHVTVAVSALPPGPRHADTLQPAEGDALTPAYSVPTSATQWPSALLLAAHLVAHPSLVAGRRVLELGCGCSGLPGRVAAALGAAAVCFTDAELAALTCVREAAAPCADATCRISTQQLVWGSDRVSGMVLQQLVAARDEAKADADASAASLQAASAEALGVQPHVPMEQVQHSQGWYDVLLGADVMYESAAFEPLLATVRVLLEGAAAAAATVAPHPLPAFIMAYQVRSASRTVGPILSRLGLQARLLPLPDAARFAPVAVPTAAHAASVRCIPLDGSATSNIVDSAATASGRVDVEWETLALIQITLSSER